MSTCGVWLWAVQLISGCALPSVTFSIILWL